MVFFLHRYDMMTYEHKQAGFHTEITSHRVTTRTSDATGTRSTSVPNIGIFRPVFVPVSSFRSTSNVASLHKREHYYVSFGSEDTAGCLGDEPEPVSVPNEPPPSAPWLPAAATTT